MSDRKCQLECFCACACFHVCSFMSVFICLCEFMSVLSFKSYNLTSSLPRMSNVRLSINTRLELYKCCRNCLESTVLPNDVYVTPFQCDSLLLSLSFWVT